MWLYGTFVLAAVDWFRDGGLPFNVFVQLYAYAGKGLGLGLGVRMINYLHPIFCPDLLIMHDNACTNIYISKKK